MRRPPDGFGNHPIGAVTRLTAVLKQLFRRLRAVLRNIAVLSSGILSDFEAFFSFILSDGATEKENGQKKHSPQLRNAL